MISIDFNDMLDTQNAFGLQKSLFLSHIVISLFFANSQNFSSNIIFLIDGQVQNTELVPN